MVPDRQKVWTDGMDGRTDNAKTISPQLRRGIIKNISDLVEIAHMKIGSMGYIAYPDQMAWSERQNFWRQTFKLRGIGHCLFTPNLFSLKMSFLIILPLLPGFILEFRILRLT